MRFESPSSSFHADAAGIGTGLAGTVGVQILNGDGTVHTARVTAGITEKPTGSGHYVVALTAPDTASEYTIAWDDGSGNWVFETLTVTYTPLEAATGPNYITAADVKASLTLDGTTYADADVARAVAAANAVVDQLFGRSFGKDGSATDRYYSVRRSSIAMVEIRDLTRDTEPVVAVDTAGDGTFATPLTENTDFVFEPLNAVEDGLPYERIVMLGGRTLPAGRRRVKVTGTHGWPAVPAQIPSFAEVIAVKLVARFRDAPFGIVTAGADIGVAMRLARTDPDFPTLSAGLTKGALIA